MEEDTSIGVLTLYRPARAATPSVHVSAMKGHGRYDVHVAGKINVAEKKINHGTELVNTGHCDKICDQVSDAVLVVGPTSNTKCKDGCGKSEKEDMVFVCSEFRNTSKIDCDTAVRGAVMNIRSELFIHTQRLTLQVVSMLARMLLMLTFVTSVSHSVTGVMKLRTLCIWRTRFRHEQKIDRFGQTHGDVWRLRSDGNNGHPDNIFDQVPDAVLETCHTFVLPLQCHLRDLREGQLAVQQVR